MVFSVVGQIAEVIWTSLVMGVGATVLYACVILGSSRAAEARRTGQGPAALYGVLAATALIGFMGAVVFGLIIILHKS